MFRFTAFKLDPFRPGRLVQDFAHIALIPVFVRFVLPGITGPEIDGEQERDREYKPSYHGFLQPIKAHSENGADGS
jgi:hypothetical protein